MMILERKALDWEAGIGDYGAESENTTAML
jgi:hypothetical protein